MFDRKKEGRMKTKRKRREERRRERRRESVGIHECHRMFVKRVRVRACVRELFFRYKGVAVFVLIADDFAGINETEWK